MKKLLFTFYLISISFLGFNQNFWQHLDINDGLISNNVKDIVVENNQSIYLVTDSGLSHFNQGVFTNFSVNNSNLNTNNILKILLGSNKLYIHTDSGVSIFDGITFSNYTAANGLPSNEVKEIQLTSNNVLWIGTTTGVASFDGAQFTQYPNKVAYALGVDSLDQVYIVNSSYFFVDTVINEFEKFNGTSWSNYIINDTQSTNLIYKPRFKLLNNGQLIIKGDNSEFYNFQNNQIKKLPFISFNPNSSLISSKQIDADNHGKFWTTTDNTYRKYKLLSGQLDSLELHTFNTTFNKINSIDIGDNIIAFATDKGFIYGDTSIKPLVATYNFDVNTIATNVYNDGSFFQNQNEGIANFEFPKGSGIHSIYSANFIVSVKKSNSNNFNVHPTNYFVADCFIGPKNNQPEVTRSFISKVTQTEITQHISSYNTTGYQMPDGIAYWPATGDSLFNEPMDLAPFIDVNANGCYDPQNGDYPAIKGDEAVYWINHPNDTSALSDLEYHNMIYAFYDTTDYQINQSLFLERTIVNRATIAYDSIKVGFNVDFDLGGAADDYVGSDSLNNIMYGYNGDADDANSQGQKGYGVNPPSLGVKFLYDSMDVAGYFTLGINSNNGSPKTAADWHNYLNARWKDGTPFKYGGNGFNSAAVTNIPTRYFFTGNPVTNKGWTENNPGSGSPANPPGDRRFTASIPYFSLQPNERKTIALAIGYGFDSISSGSSYLNAVPAMIQSLNHAKSVYDSIPAANSVLASNYNCPIIRVGIEDQIADENNLSIYPIPSNGKFTIASNEQLNYLQIIDVRGAVIDEIYLSAKGINPTIQLKKSIKDGFYFLRIQLKDKSWATKKIIISN